MLFSRSHHSPMSLPEELRLLGPVPIVFPPIAVMLFLMSPARMEWPLLTCSIGL